MRKLVTAVTAVAALAFVQAASAEEVVINLATTAFPKSSNVVKGFQPWAEKVNRAGKGVLRIDLKHGTTIANHGNFFQRTMDDVVQIGYGFHSNISGRFPRTGVVDIPFVADHAEPASVALWRLFKSGLLDDEYKDIVPLFMCVYPQVGIHTRGAIKNLETLSGVKLASTSKGMLMAAEKLGASPSSLVIIELYEATQRGTIDGFLLPWPAMATFKFHEVTKFHIDSQFGTASSFSMLSRKKFDSYPVEVRRILVDHGGEAESRRWGKNVNEDHEEGRKLVQQMGGHTIVSPPPELSALYKKKMQPIADEWVAQTPNGARLLETWLKLRGEAEKEFAAGK